MLRKPYGQSLLYPFDFPRVKAASAYIPSFSTTSRAEAQRLFANSASAARTATRTAELTALGLMCRE